MRTPHVPQTAIGASDAVAIAARRRRLSVSLLLLAKRRAAGVYRGSEPARPTGNSTQSQVSGLAASRSLRKRHAVRDANGASVVGVSAATRRLFTVRI